MEQSSSIKLLLFLEINENYENTFRIKYEESS